MRSLFAKQVNRLTPALHAAIKRSPRAARVARTAFRVGGDAVSSGRRRFGLSSDVEGPLGSLATSDWVEESGLGSLIELEPAGRSQRRPPRTVGHQPHPSFLAGADVAFPARWVAVVPDGRAYGQVVVVTPDNRVLADVSRTEEAHVTASGETIYDTTWPDHLPKPRRLVGRAALLTDYRAMGYGHWMMEVVPRWQMVLDAGFDLESIDHVIVNGTLASFQQETLRLLGIPDSKIVQSIWSQHVVADELIVPSNIGDIRSPHPWAFRHLKEQFGPKPRSDEGEPRRRLYVTRTQTTHRRVENEDDVRRVLGERGFEVFVPEDYGLADKARLFAAAEAVVGPTGAGLTHLVFCEPGTRVIEFLNPDALDLYYWSAANVLDLDHSYVSVAASEPAETGSGPGSSTDVSVDLDQLTRTLDAVGLG